MLYREGNGFNTAYYDNRGRDGIRKKQSFHGQAKQRTKDNVRTSTEMNHRLRECEKSLKEIREIAQEILIPKTT